MNGDDPAVSRTSIRGHRPDVTRVGDLGLPGSIHHAPASHDPQRAAIAELILRYLDATARFEKLQEPEVISLCDITLLSQSFKCSFGLVCFNNINI